jgi:hypothetical protein
MNEGIEKCVYLEKDISCLLDAYNMSWRFDKNKNAGLIEWPVSKDVREKEESK